VLSEQDVVTRVRVERRVEVDQVDALVLDVPPQYIEVVAVVEEVAFHGWQPTAFRLICSDPRLPSPEEMGRVCC
jgi:hypothetical protein